MKDPIKDYLASIIFLVQGKQLEYYNWILEKGISYEVNEIETQKYLKQSPLISGEIKIKSCFSNSLKSSLYDSDLKYVEGFYSVCEGLVTEHAWNVRNEVAMDFTSSKFNLAPTHHFGVEIPRDVLENLIYDTEEVVSLENYFKYESRIKDFNLNASNKIIH